MIKWIINKLKVFYFKPPFGKTKLSGSSEAYFDTIRNVDSTPNLHTIKENELVEVIFRGKSYWALFKCPCGCREVITLSTQESHTPHWIISKNNCNKPTLYPSVWQNNGCFSHYWIKNGKVEWCYITGVEPGKTELE